MKIHPKQNWISTNVKERINTPLIPLIKAETEEEKSSNIIKVNTRRDLASSASEMYKLHYDQC